MLSVNLKHKLSIHTASIIFAMTVILPVTSLAHEKNNDRAGDTRTWVKKLYPTTGFNTDCDKPVFSLPAPLPADLHFDFIGLYNPDAPTEGPMRDAFTLQQSDCEFNLDKYVASTSNLDLLALLGAPEPDTRLKNLRTNEIPKISTPAGVRSTLPAENAVMPPFPPTNNATTKSMTLHEFRNIHGKMNVKCYADGTAKIKIRLRHYQPNELLTVWAIWLATPPGAPGPAPVPLPFGGVPNVVVTNANGAGEFKRTLSYCPMDVQPNGEQLLLLDIASHLDGNVYGAVPGTQLLDATFVDPADPSTTFTSSLSEGIMTVNRGAFPMRVSQWK